MQLGNPPSAQAILLPVRAGTILGSLTLALLLNFLPWNNIALVPDFVALVLAFAAIALSRRILWFPLWSQALHVAALLLFAQGVAALVRLAAGADFPGWSIAVGPLIGAVLWPVVSLVLLLPQRLPVNVDDTRAI